MKFAADLSNNIIAMKAQTHPVIGAPHWTPEVREAVRRTMEVNPDVSRQQVAQMLRVDYMRVVGVHKDFESQLKYYGR